MASAKANIKKLEEENKWIPIEKEFFGSRGTKYDFHNFNKGEKTLHLNKLKEENEELKKKTNFKVDSLFDKTE